MARDRRRLAGDSLHQVAVADDRENPMGEQWRAAAVIETRRHVLGRDRHPDAVAEALPQRPGRGLDARRDSMFRMARGFAAELAEAFDLLERQVVAAQIERGVQQHRAVSGRQHEAIAPVPVRILRVVPHEAREQEIRHRRHPHRHPRMARVGLLHRVDRDYANRIDAKLIEVGLRSLEFGCECHFGSTRRIKLFRDYSRLRCWRPVCFAGLRWPQESGRSRSRSVD